MRRLLVEAQHARRPRPATPSRSIAMRTASGTINAGGAIEARVHAVLRMDDAVEQPGRVAGRLRRNPCASLEQGAAPSLLGEGPGGSRTRPARRR
jgi:hypothetical protein